MTDLLKEALAEPVRTGNQVSMTRLLPVVDALRRKGFTYHEIYAWLKDRGERVQKTAQTFESGMSRLYRRWIDKQHEAALRASAPKHFSVSNHTKNNPTQKNP